MPWASSPVVFPFGGSVSAISTGWNGSINYLFILVPNWLAVIFAAALAVVGWLRGKGIEFKPGLDMKLAQLGAGHALIFILWVLVWGRPAIFGLGCFATFVAFVAIVRLLKRGQLSG